MRKTAAHDFWFTLSSTRDAGGRAVRAYIIKCRKCPTTADYHAHALGNDKLKKLFTRQGWRIGKTVNQHTCPACSVPKPATAQAGGPRLRDLVGTNVVALPVPPLQAAWEAAGGAEREAFLHWLHKAKPHDEAAHVPWQNGSHIDSMPTQPALDEANHPPPANAALEAEDEADGPGADWWEEVMAK